ncbi:cellulose-binding domain-containing protein [Catenuloplanes sp. NPDC051500]|uniref:cellulose-binding domain-containing protein n=1 Tax=Catenuloplanes sp. NPDC051500 TaxID=3363959 RepID=UPI0037AE3295
MRKPSLIAGMIAVAMAASGVMVATAQAAAAGCRVVYSTPSQWGGGFSGTVSVTNLGDAVTGWRLTFSFPGGQQISQLWNGSYTQSGGAVTVTNAAWNGTLATNAEATVGFNATGSTATPTGFALNGVTCTGSATPTTAAPTTPAPTTPAPQPSTWNPPANLTGALDAVWRHQEETYGNLYGFRNYIWDQLTAAQGSINYCVRWDSSAPVSAALRDQIEVKLGQQFNKWIAAMAGFDGFPYTNVPVNVVGWAVRDRNTLQWTDNSVDIYVNNIRENAPQCAEPCGRFFNQSGSYPNCPGGYAHHYDMSLWLTAGMSGGAGGDWGQRVGSEYYVNSLNQENQHILLHEIGHGLGLDDFYDWDPGVGGFLMKAGSATQITEFDKWMARDWWRHLKSRYGL